MEKNDHFTSLKKLILADMILLPLIPFALTLAIGYTYFTSSIENATIASLKRVVGDHRHMIESFLEERQANLEFILYSYSFEEISDPVNLRNIFTRLQKQSNAFVDLGVFNKDGVHVAYEGEYKLTGIVYKDADWFIEVMKNGFYISNIFLGFRQIPHFIIAVARESGGEKWVLRATIDSNLFNAMVKKVSIGKTGEAYLLNTEGVFQTDRRSGGNLMEVDPDYNKYPAFSTIAGIRNMENFPISDTSTSPDIRVILPEIDTFIISDIKDIRYLYATTWLKNQKWLLVVRQEKADAFQSLIMAVSLIVIICIIGGIAIILSAFYLTGKIVKRISVADSEKNQLQEQLIRAHRLAELGEMAAGFAHEINNPLQIIKSEQSLILMNLSELKENGQLPVTEGMDEIYDSLNQIGIQIDRCSAITQSILKFGRQSKPVIQIVDLKDFIPEVLRMITKKATVHGIDLTLNIDENTPGINGDSGQLQQVLLNLYNNAIDAITERHGSQGGKLITKAGRNENGKVEISVIDNGVGISQENLKKIFSPFFTTKPVGKGTGLGLSVCYGIIDSIGGEMSVSSEKGVGTTFTIFLPMA